MTATSTFIASMLRAVSLSDSPFETDDPDDEKLTTSAESRFSASSKEIRVRVDASKKRLHTVSPRSVGTRLMGRSSTSRKCRAVRRIRRHCRSTGPADAGDLAMKWWANRSPLLLRLHFVIGITAVVGLWIDEPDAFAVVNLAKTHAYFLAG